MQHQRQLILWKSKATFAETEKADFITTKAKQRLYRKSKATICGKPNSYSSSHATKQRLLLGKWNDCYYINVSMLLLLLQRRRLTNFLASSATASPGDHCFRLFWLGSEKRSQPLLSLNQAQQLIEQRKAFQLIGNHHITYR